MGKSNFMFKYKVRIRPEYNRPLVRRNSLTLRFDERAVTSWPHEEFARGGRTLDYHRYGQAYPCR
jgi:hypothetical protein